jgi:hypothetical protein
MNIGAADRARPALSASLTAFPPDPGLMLEIAGQFTKLPEQEDERTRDYDQQHKIDDLHGRGLDPSRSNAF